MLLSAQTMIANTASYSAAALARICDLEETIDAHCKPYLAGVFEETVAISVYDRGNQNRFCIGSTLDDRDLVSIFIDWVGDHPDSIDSPAVSAMAAALIDRYPCPMPVDRTRIKVRPATWVLGQKCDSANQRDRDICRHYLLGVVDTSLLYREARNRGYFCVPAFTSPSGEELVNAFARWWERNPGKHHYPAVNAARAVLTERFPCGPQDKPPRGPR